MNPQQQQHDPIYCQIEYDPKEKAGRLLQTLFCVALGDVSQTLRCAGETEAVWMPFCHLVQRKFCSVTSV